MKRILKRAMAVALTAVMLLTAAPLSGFVGLDLPNWADLFTLKADAAAYSGKCGANLTWSLEPDTGVLTIRGTGDMYDWSSSSNVPWYSNRSRVKTVVIGDSVTSIGQYAFYKCTGLTSVTIPDSVTSIGHGAFYDCTRLTSVTIPDSVTSIGSYAFRGCTGLTSVTIPDSVASIGEATFRNCTQLTSVTIPDSVTSIGNYAFGGCTGLTSITIPDSVTSIGDEAFRGCTGLTSITIPDSVTSIGDGAFYNCTGLKELTIPCSAKIYNSEYTFYYCTNIEKVTLTKGTGKMQVYGTSTSSSSSTTHYSYTPWYKSREKIKEIVIEEGVQNIGSYAFYDCTGLTSVTIPDSVTSIGDSAFYGCTGLTSVTIPDSVTSIGNDSFSGCTGLTSVTIGNSVTSIGNYAFRNCTGLTSVTIPDSVTSIGDSAFYGCTGLEEMVIPYSVKSIGTAAFTGCTNLGSLTVYSRNCTFADDATAYYTTIYGFTGSTAETYANEKGFDFVAIDDTHTHIYDNDCDSICNLCGAERTVGEHIFGDYTVTKEPTCTEQGEKTRTCSVCGYSETTEVPALGHAYDATVTTEPTCTTDGVKTFTCKNCGDTYTEAIPAKGHTWGDWTVIKEATQTEAGQKRRECSACDAFETLPIPMLPTIAIRNFQSNPKLDYRTTITFAAEVTNHADGGEIHWFVDSKDMGTGDTYTMKEAKKNFTVQAKYMKDGKVLAESETETVTVKTGFFDKLKAFFRALFRKLPVVVQEYLGVEIIDRVLP